MDSRRGALGIERDQLFRVRRYIYGLPDAGRAFYELFKSKLEEEGYTMSEMDPCLFYRINYDEETYIVIFVDDSFVHSNRKEYIREYEQKMRKHFEITTDPEVESFLGVTFTYDEEGNCKLGQKKLLTKLFNDENPSLQTGKRWQSPTHPYGPAPTHGWRRVNRGGQASSGHHSVLATVRNINVPDKESTRQRYPSERPTLITHYSITTRNYFT